MFSSQHTARPSTPARDEQAQRIFHLQDHIKQRDAQLATSLEREAVFQAEVDTANAERDCALKVVSRLCLLFGLIQILFQCQIEDSLLLYFQPQARDGEEAADLWKSRFLDLLSEQADKHLRDLEEGPSQKVWSLSLAHALYL